MANNDPQDLVSGSIDDFLLALADGVHKTQRQLSQISIRLQPGQPAVTYQLPRVDFEFRVAFELALAAGDQSLGRGGALRLRPAGGDAGPRQSASAEAASIIKGSFVAVPALGGKPPSVVTTDLERIAARKLRITVHTASAAGEDLAGIPVEFNVDRELSRQLNQDQDLVSDPTDVWHGLVHTDDRGLAETVAEVHPDDPVGAFVAVRIDVLAETRTITFQIEG